MSQRLRECFLTLPVGIQSRECVSGADVDLDAVEVVADGGGDVPLARLHVEHDGETVLPTRARLEVHGGFARIPVGMKRSEPEFTSNLLLVSCQC